MDEIKRVRGVSPVVRQLAGKHRISMTDAERQLWEAIRGKQLAGLRFRSQHPIGRFILDFYCPACKLAIELDGGIHENQREQDAARTELLEAYGITVIRFQNEEVSKSLAVVLDAISKAAQIS